MERIIEFKKDKKSNLFYERGEIMTDRLTDISIINEIYQVSGVEYFNDSIKSILQEVIKDIYYSHSALVFKLRLKHLDRAIYKYRNAKEKTYIFNTRQYLKACIVSAILETDLEELEPIEI